MKAKYLLWAYYASPTIILAAAVSVSVLIASEGGPLQIAEDALWEISEGRHGAAIQLSEDQLKAQAPFAMSARMLPALAINSEGADTSRLALLCVTYGDGKVDGDLTELRGGRLYSIKSPAIAEMMAARSPCT